MINRAMGPVEWTMLILLSVVWGGSFFFYAVAVKELPTFTIVFLRVALGSAGLWLCAWATGLLPLRQSGVWRNFFIMGLINNAIPFSLIVWGQHAVASGLAAILNATTPFFTVLAANLLTADEKLSWNRLLGAVIGLSGVAAMMGAGIFAAHGPILSQLAIVLAAVSYAFASVFGRRFATVPPLLTAAGQTTASSLILLPVMIIVDMPWRLPSPSMNTWLAIVGIALLCTSLAYFLYFTILRRAGATNIVLVTFLAPVSAILLGIAFLGETLGANQIVGMAAIAIGLLLIDGRLPALLKARRA